MNEKKQLSHLKNASRLETRKYGKLIGAWQGKNGNN